MEAYLVGNVVDRILEDINCPLCSTVLVNHESDPLDAEAALFIRMKNNEETNSGLKFLSASVLFLVKQAEEMFQSKVVHSAQPDPHKTFSESTNLLVYLVDKCLIEFPMNEHLFPWLECKSQPSKREHFEALYKRILLRYLQMRFLSFIPSFYAKNNEQKVFRLSRKQNGKQTEQLTSAQD